MIQSVKRITLTFVVTLIGFVVFGTLLPLANASPQATDILAIYVLAFDNDPASSVDLSKRYTETVDAIVAATVDQTVTKQVVILADRGGTADTEILLVSAGAVTTVEGLPNSSGILDTGLTEYNTASGEALGGFLIWALKSFTADNRLFSYVGHGAPLIPETDISTALDLDESGAIPDPNPNDVLLPPLPIHVDVNPALTDFSSLDLISPYDLAYMLKQAADLGLPVIDVFDMVHCFSGTIEEIYEIATVVNATGQNQATTLVASPNYAFFAPTMLGHALGTMTVSNDSSTLASNLVTAYDEHILSFDTQDGPTTINHPRQLVAIVSEHVADIKKAWDEVSYYLLKEFTRTTQVLPTVYSSDTVDKYDTTYCAPLDFELASPDALVDLTRLARELAANYGGNEPVATAAIDTIQAIDQAVIINTIRNGEPWFAGSPKPVWEFDETAGIAIYADLVGMNLDGNKTPTLLWQAHWYTDTQFAGVASNSHPYTFVQGGYDGATWQPTGSGVNWADLLHRWWQESLVGVQAPLATAACIPEFPPMQSDRIVLPLMLRSP